LFEPACIGDKSSECAYLSTELVLIGVRSDVYV